MMLWILTNLRRFFTTGTNSNLKGITSVCRLLAANVEVILQISLSWRFTLDSQAAFRSQYFKQ